MAGLSASSWVILVLGCVIFFGGSIYTLLIAMGKKPDSYLEKLGLFRHMDSIGSKAREIGIYKPFEYMDRGNKEKALGAFVVLVLLLIGWWTGVYEEVESGELYEVTLRLREETWHEESAYVNEGNTQEYSYDFTDWENILSFEITLVWNDDQPGLTGGDNDDFTLEFSYSWCADESDPEHGDEQDSSDSGQIVLRQGTPITMPNSTGFEDGASKEEVEERFIHTLTGEIYVNVTCDNAGNPDPFRDDDGNDFDMIIEVTYYTVEVTEIPLPA